MVKTKKQYRGIYKRPASYLDKEYNGKTQAYVTERTGPCDTMQEARAKALYRSEETLAVFVGYEECEVTRTPWKKVEE